uniref:Uncharacterized protein n=1 Tax=Anopheles darlingi TaxID=43151 RepID=A0A2M4DCF6_ANODA
MVVVRQIGRQLLPIPHEVLRSFFGFLLFVPFSFCSYAAAAAAADDIWVPLGNRSRGFGVIVVVDVVVVVVGSRYAGSARWYGFRADWVNWFRRFCRTGEAGWSYAGRLTDVARAHSSMMVGAAECFPRSQYRGTQDVPVHQFLFCLNPIDVLNHFRKHNRSIPCTAVLQPKAPDTNQIVFIAVIMQQLTTGIASASLMDYQRPRAYLSRGNVELVAFVYR